MAWQKRTLTIKTDEDIITNTCMPCTPLVTSPTPQLQFGGRIEDSIYLPVFNTTISISGDSGIFRYDIATDSAAIVATQPTISLGSAPNPLDPYPWFIHFAPGKPLFPVSGFEVALSIAESYRSNCAWEKALRWSRVAPLGHEIPFVGEEDEAPVEVADGLAPEFGG